MKSKKIKGWKVLCIIGPLLVNLVCINLLPPLSLHQSLSRIQFFVSRILIMIIQWLSLLPTRGLEKSSPIREALPTYYTGNDSEAWYSHFAYQVLPRSIIKVCCQTSTHKRLCWLVDNILHKEGLSNVDNLVYFGWIWHVLQCPILRPNT